MNEVVNEDAIAEATAGDGAHADGESSNRFHMGDEAATLREEFIANLRTLQADEMAILEQKIKDARHADTDMFGIKRRFCTVC